MLVTIGIPFYNCESFLADAIKCILAQTYTHWELILVDDGSKDNSLKIAQQYAAKDERIRIISDETNKRLPYRLNQIISEAQGEYIARMDADDLIAIDRIEKQLNFLKNNKQFDLVSTGILSVKNDLSLVGYRGSKPNKKVSLSDAILGTTGIIHASILARKEWCIRNLYNEYNKLAEDYELWLNAYLKNDLKVGFIEDALYFYREDQNIKLDKLIQAYDTQIAIIDNIEPSVLENKLKNKFVKKFKVKKFLVKILFFLKMDTILHKRRVSIESNDFYEKVLKENISFLKNGKVK
jgi:glycosyltransferase involved in cell wall biosynthesis